MCTGMYAYMDTCTHVIYNFSYMPLEHSNTKHNTDWSVGPPWRTSKMIPNRPPIWLRPGLGQDWWGGGGGGGHTRSKMLLVMMLSCCLENGIPYMQ